MFTNRNFSPAGEYPQPLCQAYFQTQILYLPRATASLAWHDSHPVPGIASECSRLAKPGLPPVPAVMLASGSCGPGGESLNFPLGSLSKPWVIYLTVGAANQPKMAHPQSTFISRCYRPVQSGSCQLVHQFSPALPTASRHVNWWLLWPNLTWPMPCHGSHP